MPSFTVSACWECHYGSNCRTEDKTQTHSTWHIEASGRSEIARLFIRFAEKLYETKGRLNYSDGTSFQLFEFFVGDDYYDIIVQIQDLGYFESESFGFIQVLQDFMTFVLYNKSKESSKSVEYMVDKYLYIEKVQSIDNRVFDLY